MEGVWPPPPLATPLNQNNFGLTDDFRPDGGLAEVGTLYVFDLRA